MIKCSLDAECKAETHRECLKCKKLLKEIPYLKTLSPRFMWKTLNTPKVINQEFANNVEEEINPY